MVSEKAKHTASTSALLGGKLDSTPHQLRTYGEPGLSHPSGGKKVPCSLPAVPGSPFLHRRPTEQSREPVPPPLSGSYYQSRIPDLR